MNEEEGSEVDNDEEIEDTEEYEESENEPDVGETTSVLTGSNMDSTHLDGGSLCSYFETYANDLTVMLINLSLI